MTSPQPSSGTSTVSFVLDVRDVGDKQAIPNRQPDFVLQKKLAIVARHPIGDDLAEKAPFGGATGRMIFNTLARHGIARASCLMAYLDNDIAGTSTTGTQLIADLKAFQPNCILALDYSDKPALLPWLRSTPKLKVTQWRGSILQVLHPELPPFKFIPTFHPQSVFKNWDYSPLFFFDLKRAADESSFAELQLPERNFDLNADYYACIAKLQSLQPGMTIALDIEGGVRGMSCISFATSPRDAFIIPWNTFTLQQQCDMVPELSRVLGDPRIKKILQNCLYDNFVLTYAYRMPIRGIVSDTMLSGWEIYPELPKSLGTQASIWTREPYYKDDRSSDDNRTLWEYCCRDSAVTFEIAQQHQTALSPAALSHYEFNLALLEPVLYMELRGIRYDKATAQAEEAAIYKEMSDLQAAIDKRAGTPVNNNAPKQMCNVLYSILKYPPQYPMDKETKGRDKTRLTSNVDACLELMKLNPDDAFMANVLRWRSLDKLRLAVTTGVDPDGRVRCAYNVVGTETGRFTCYESPTGSGFNLQTVTGDLRKLYLADEGYSFFQNDLSGADGWTVAAHCKRLGDPTMYDDYMHGIKPAKVIALLYKHGTVVNTWSREDIVKASKDINESGSTGWLYFACKRVQHGTNYGLGKARMADQILKDSYKKQGKTIYVSPQDCVKLQQLYLSRYSGVARWQKWVKDQVQTGKMSCASGHVRRFFGRYDAHTTYMAALAHEPQANTTYATNLALLNLWRDPENNVRFLRSNAGQHTLSRLPSDVAEYVVNTKRRLIIEPLHQVHDALCGQFPTHLAGWAGGKLRTYFDNPLEIAHQTITIPYDGGYGPSWGQCKTPFPK